ncbi:MAG: FkbM family methyltransferase [Alphaproteobacteria bacterium]|nr:FkbM family methyltransferase [Alphaproteobacteria bacterium]
MTGREAEFYLRAAYLAFLEREPDADGLRHWRTQLEASGDPLALISDLIASTEYQRRASGDAGLIARVAGPPALPGGYLKRAWRSARRRLGLFGLRAQMEALQRVEVDIALLAAWAAHVTANIAGIQPASAISTALDGLAERWRKDQMALAARLLSIESSLAASRAGEERDAARFSRIEEALQQERAGTDRQLKEQLALASRLLSMEEAQAHSRANEQQRDARLRDLETMLAQARAHGEERDSTLRSFDGALTDMRTDNQRRDTRLQALEGAFEVRRPGAAGISTQSLADAGLNLTTGPYGRFLTIVPDLVGGALERGEFWDPHLKAIIERCADPRLTAVDAGAYIGFHSVFLARHFGRVYSFEPQMRCFRLLNANLELNRCDNVTAYNRPLYDAEALMDLAGDEQQQIPVKMRDGAVDYGQIGNAAALAFVPVDGARPAGVWSTTIDSLGLRDVGFIKVDTQGCDLRVLCGARHTIAASRPTIVFEFEQELASNHGDTLEDFHRFFEECGYRTTEIAHSGARQWDFLATPADSSSGLAEAAAAG